MTIKRGRPRPQYTLDLDEAVYLALIAGPRGRTDLASSLGVTINVMYLSLRRLREAGRVDIYRHGKRHLWMHYTQG